MHCMPDAAAKDAQCRDTITGIGSNTYRSNMLWTECVSVSEDAFGEISRKLHGQSLLNFVDNF